MKFSPFRLLLIIPSLILLPTAPFAIRALLQRGTEPMQKVVSTVQGEKISSFFVGLPIDDHFAHGANPVILKKLSCNRPTRIAKLVSGLQAALGLSTVVHAQDCQGC